MMGVSSSVGRASGIGIGLGLGLRRRTGFFAQAFGTLSANPSLAASYVGAVFSTTGIIWPQLSAAPPAAAITGGSTDPVYEDRGAIADPWGGGVWCLPPTTNLAPNPFDFSAGAGWTIQPTMTFAPSTVPAPGGFAQKLNQTATPMAYSIVAIGSTASPITFSCWYQWDAIDPPTGGFPAFIRAAFTPFVGGLLPNVGTLTRYVATFSGGTSTAVGITAAGSNAGGSGANAGTGAIDVSGFQAVVGDSNDRPLIVGTASAGKILDATHSALLVDANGNIDFQITFLPSVGSGSERSTSYLWSFTTSDGLASLRMVASGGGITFVLTVRAVDVVDTSVTISGLSSGQPTVCVAGEPTTVRVWYSVTAGECGIRVSNAGAYLPDATAATTGGAIVAPSTVYFGTNLGSATAAFVGRLKPWVRPVPSRLAPPQVFVEGVLFGDSIVSPFTAGPSPASYLYTGGAAGEWVTRAGIGIVARPLYKALDEYNWWLNNVVKWRGQASIKWGIFQVGINDLLVGHSATTVLADIQTLVTQFKTDQSSAKIIVCTPLPAGAYSGWTAPIHIQWTAVNAGLLAGTVTGIDLVIDAGGRGSPLNDGADNLATPYDNGDGLHTNAAGRKLQAFDAGIGWRSALHSLALI